MIAVIVAGGSGTRLWPLSTSNKPKHLLRLTDDRSLLQNTYKRASKLTSEIYVLTDESHSQEVINQLPEVKKKRIIIEPGRRGTASCITLAIAKIAAEQGAETDIAFFHADHHISDIDSFAATVKKITRNSSIALLFKFIGQFIGFIFFGLEVKISAIFSPL